MTSYIQFDWLVKLFSLLSVSKELRLCFSFTTCHVTDFVPRPLSLPPEVTKSRVDHILFLPRFDIFAQ